MQAGSVAIAPSLQYPQEYPADKTGFNRPEIQQIDAMISAAREQLKQARGGYRPTADLFASYQLDKGFVHDGEQGDSWMTGVRVNYNLYEGDLTRATVARAEAELARLRETRHRLTLAIGLEIEQARLNLQQAEERLKVTANQVQLATESARLFQERFKEGVILASSLLDAQSRLTEAQVHASLAKAARLIAIADLRKAVGVAQFPQCSPTNAQ
jgi:outer membrane protein TolC